MRTYEAGGHLVGKDGVRREITIVAEAWVNIEGTAVPVPKWAADCMHYEPPVGDVWFSLGEIRMHPSTAGLCNRILTDRLGKPSEWVRKKDVVRAVWHAGGELRSNGIDRLAKLGITHKLAKES